MSSKDPDRPFTSPSEPSSAMRVSVASCNVRSAERRSSRTPACSSLAQERNTAPLEIVEGVHASGDLVSFIESEGTSQRDLIVIVPGEPL